MRSRCVRFYLPDMFRNITLFEAFERLADDEDWREFCELKPEGDVGTWIWIISMGMASRTPNPREQAILRYRELWAKYAELTRQKLLGGEWVADGFNPQFGARAVQIDARHWRILEFDFNGEVEGGGFKFVNLSISEVRPHAATLSHIDGADLRRELTRWIENQARSADGPMTSDQVLAAARRAFDGTKITDNMFREVWRLASKPEHFRQRGRPKAKVGGN